MNWDFLFGGKTFGATRAKGWRRFREANIENYCRYCDSFVLLELHHIIPFNVAPEKELDKDNVVTLCRWCHFKLGHFCDWWSWNENILNWIEAKNQKP